MNQVKAQPIEIYDSLQELLIYESIEQILAKNKEVKTLQETLAEIENIAKEIGMKIIDLLIRDIQYKFQTQLDTMKFICTEFWKFTFSKQVDNLRTNNVGTFIMTDEAFKFIARVSSSDNESKEFRDKIKCYESFICGLIKGALINLGYEYSLPQVVSQIKDYRLQLTITVAAPSI